MLVRRLTRAYRIVAVALCPARVRTTSTNLRNVLIDEATLTRQVEQHIAYLVYRPDLREFSEAEVRVLLGDFILDSLGIEIRHVAR